MTDDPTPTAPARRGPPSDYSEELAARICELIADGMSLREVCDMAGMPHRCTVLGWARRHPEFAAAYGEAIKQRADILFEDMLEEALEATPANTQCERFKWDAKRFHIGRLNPKKYGDKVVNEHTGADGGPVMLQPVAPMVHPQVAAGIKALLADAESAAGIVPAEGTDDTTRLKSLMLSGSPLHPKLWAALRKDGDGHD